MYGSYLSGNMQWAKSGVISSASPGNLSDLMKKCYCWYLKITLLAYFHNRMKHNFSKTSIFIVQKIQTFVRIAQAKQDIWLAF